ncbi:MAG TPA: aminomethyl transferase family protein [Nitrospirales bacterium]|nr:aminomethyl transferase family protein [Nitrospirales bacterium]
MKSSTHHGDPNAEHAIVRSGVGIADVSDRGKLKISGADRATYLQGLVTNDMLKLADGVGMYCAILTPKGKMQSYFRIFGIDETFVIDLDEEAIEPTYQLLKRYLLYGTKAKLENVTDAYGHLAIHGPLSETLLRKACDQPLPELTIPHCAKASIATHQLIIVKTNECGEDGYDLLMPVESITPVSERISETATSHNIQPFGAIGADALEILRIEAGTPRYGRELDDEVFPAEAWLEEKAVSLSKGCYMGQETVARIDTYGDVKRRLVGVTISGSSLPEYGTELMGKDEDPRAAGRITSAIHSPSLNQVIGLAYLRKKYLDPGTELTVTTDGEIHNATVASLPFPR